MTKEQIKTGLPWIIVLLVIIGGYFMVNRERPAPKVADKKDSASTYIKDQYIKGCIDESDASQYDYCACTYDKFESKLGKDGIVNLGLEYNRTGKFPEGTVDMISECFSLLK